MPSRGYTIERRSLPNPMRTHSMFLPSLPPLFGAALLALLGMTPLAAQTAPKILTSGVERPASVIFIGNSFFYYNNSLHNHVLRLVSAADPAYQLRAPSGTLSGSGAGRHHPPLPF